MVLNKIKIILRNASSCCCSRRDEKVILFGAWFGNRFADNSRYLFQYLSDNKQQLGLKHIVWVTRNKNVLKNMNNMGYECYMMNSKESVYFHKKAGIHIICNNADEKTGDILPMYSSGALKINLWHGLGGIKGVEFASKQYEIAKNKKPLKYNLKEYLNRSKLYRKAAIRYGGWGDCYYLSTTPFQTEILQKYFYRDKQHFIEAGYPRNEKCLKYTGVEEKVLKIIKGKKNVILYLPTFRESNSEYQPPLDNVELKNILQSEDFFWIEKQHNFNGNSKTNLDNNVLYLESEFDICTIVPFVDLVITDYSSVVWDAIYHDVPVFFYVPDIKQYESADRGFILPKEKFIVGQMAYTTDELKELIVKYKNNYKSSIISDYNKIKSDMWGENSSYEKIWNAICSYKRKK